LSKRRQTKEWIWTLVALIPTVIIILPVYFIAVGGFETVAEIFHHPVYWFPPHPTLQFYKDAWVLLLPYLKNSLIVTLGTVALTLTFAVPAAFALAKFHLRVGKSVSLLLTFAQMLPQVALIIPLSLIFSKVHLMSSYVAAILGLGVFAVPFATIVLEAYMQSIPTALVEAAQVDGASMSRILRSIIVPVSKPAIATAGILTFIMAWGDFLVSLSFLKDQAVQPMSIGLYRFVAQYGTEWNKLMAGSIIFSVPPLIVALVAGGTIVAGLTAGAVKE
jgi:multiple sugar transport system permease protein